MLACKIQAERRSRDDATRVGEAFFFRASSLPNDRKPATNAHTYVSHRDANELHEDLKEVAPRVSEFGQFWLLRPDLTPLGFAASEDEDDF